MSLLKYVPIFWLLIMMHVTQGPNRIPGQCDSHANSTLIIPAEIWSRHTIQCGHRGADWWWYGMENSWPVIRFKVTCYWYFELNMLLLGINFLFMGNDLYGCFKQQSGYAKLLAVVQHPPPGSVKIGDQSWLTKGKIIGPRFQLIMKHSHTWTSKWMKAWI